MLPHLERPAMHHPTHASIIWFLAALFSLLSAVGEGWHSIPGCGHAVELPGNYLLVGATCQKGAFPVGVRSPGVESPRGNSLPCYGEDECPICRVLGQNSLRVEVAGFRPVFTTLDAVSAISLQILRVQSWWPFGARAPPFG